MNNKKIITENDFQNQIRKELSELGFTVFRMNVISSYTKDGRYIPTSLPNGFSDLMLIKDGKAHFIEVKKKGGRVSKEQKNFIEQMQKKGCVAGVVWNMKGVYELLNIERCVGCDKHFLICIESKKQCCPDCNSIERM